MAHDFSERDQRIIDAYTQDSGTLAGIGAEHGLSKERIRQILEAAGVARRQRGRRKGVAGKPLQPTE